MKTKLFLIEGLPGFGKTTTAGLIEEILKEEEVPAALFLEGNLDHPADYDMVAYFKQKEDWERMIMKYPQYERAMKEHVFKKNKGYFLAAGKMIQKNRDDYSNDFLQEIYKHDIYELPLDLNQKLVAERWRTFASRAIRQNQTYIFECCFIQNPVTAGMIKHDAPVDRVTDYVLTLEKEVKDLNPVLIYVEQDDLESSFTKVLEERQKKWSDFFIQYYTGQGYGLKHGYEGVEGTIEVLKARKALEDRLYEQLTIEKVKVNNSNYDRNSHKTYLKETIQHYM